MTKYEAIEKTVLTQQGGLKIEVEQRANEVYLGYDISEFVRSLADLTGKPVEVSVVQTIQVKPRIKDEA
jgi:hypothetical protein